MTTTNRTTMAAFVRGHQITATVSPAERNPNMPDARDMNHYVVLLRQGHHTMTVPFSQGYGITHEPTPEDLLNCLALDAAGIENARSFEEWCSEYGYDPDSRTAERTWRVTRRQSARLQRFLGPALYQSLLWETDSL